MPGRLQRRHATGVPSTEELRAAILRACNAACHIEAPRAARAGMFAAMAAVRGQPAHADPRIWLWRVRESLGEVRAAFEDPHDEDGWGLGGVATVRRSVLRLASHL